MFRFHLFTLFTFDFRQGPSYFIFIARYQESVKFILSSKTMDIFIKLNSEVGGKDKIARLLQYSCRAFWDSLDARKRSNTYLIHELKTLENLLSSFRKCKFDSQDDIDLSIV